MEEVLVRLGMHNTICGHFLSEMISRQSCLIEQKIRWKIGRQQADFIGSRQEPLDLDIGGTLIATSMHTLCAVPDTMLWAMFGGCWNNRTEEEDERVFLDRDGSIFQQWILPWLRDFSGTANEQKTLYPLQHLDPPIRTQLLREAVYFGILPLEHELHLKRVRQFDSWGCQCTPSNLQRTFQVFGRRANSDHFMLSWETVGVHEQGTFSIKLLTAPPVTDLQIGYELHNLDWREDIHCDGEHTLEEKEPALATFLSIEDECIISGDDPALDCRTPFKVEKGSVVTVNVSRSSNNAEFEVLADQTLVGKVCWSDIPMPSLLFPFVWAGSACTIEVI